MKTTMTTLLLRGFLEEMALYTDADQSGEEEDAVLMMTMHSAKGLEFPAVFLAGMEDGLFPGFRAMERDEDMEEERRLCYVAVTRAKEQLYLTCAERRMLYGRTQYAHPSRFIDEMPRELLDSNIVERRMFQQVTQPDPRAVPRAGRAGALCFPCRGRPLLCHSRGTAGRFPPARFLRRLPRTPQGIRRWDGRFGQAHGRRRAARNRLRPERHQAVNGKIGRAIYGKTDIRLEKEDGRDAPALFLLLKFNKVKCHVPFDHLYQFVWLHIQCKCYFKNRIKRRTAQPPLNLTVVRAVKSSQTAQLFLRQPFLPPQPLYCFTNSLGIQHECTLLLFSIIARAHFVSEVS